MIKVSIDLAKVDCSRVKTVTRKNGETAKFLEIVLIEKPSDYGDGFVAHSTNKDEKDLKLPILGNWKQVGHRSAPPTEQPRQQQQRPAQTKEDDDLPF